MDDDGEAAKRRPAEAAGGDGQRPTPKPRRGRKTSQPEEAPNEGALRVQLRTLLVAWSRCDAEQVKDVAEMVLRYLKLPLNTKLDVDQLRQAIVFVEGKIQQNVDYDGWLDSLVEPAAST